MSKIFDNQVIPKYMPEDLPWYERDGLLTWYDQDKYKRLTENRDKYLENLTIINFDMIYDQIRGIPL